MSGTRQVSGRVVWRGRRARLFVHALLATTSLSVVFPNVVTAQTAPAVSATRTYNIPGQSLDGALAAFSRIAGVQVLNRGTTTRGVTSPGINGTFTPQEAVSRLLAGTGLTPRFVGAGTVTLERPNSNVAGGAATVPGAIQLDQIDVQGAGNPNSTMTPMPEYAGGQVATGGQVGLLGNRNLMDTPFNQTSYTNKTIQEQQARTLNDVLVNDPSVTITSPRSSGYDQMSIRGFDAGSTSSQFSLNGLFGILPGWAVSTAMVERVEVLKGPSALLNGMPATGSAIGGSVNLVTKRAPAEPLTQLTTSYMSRATLGTHLDVGRRFGDNQEFGVRFNGTYRNGDGPVDPTREELGLGVLGLDYRGERVRLSADLGYQNQNTDGVTRVIQFANATIPVPRPPDASKSFMPSWPYFRSKDFFGTVQGEVDITDNVTAYAAVGARDNQSSNGTMNARLTNGLGDWSGTPIVSNYNTKAFSGQAGLRSTFDVGPVNHSLNLNISRSSVENGDSYVIGSPFSSNLYNPAFMANPNLRAPDPRKNSEATRSSAGIADTMSILDKRVQLTIGVRRQQVVAASFDQVTGIETSSYDSSAWSPAYALLVKPWQNVSLYANYIEGLEEGTIVGPNYANVGQVFPPWKSKQYEAGLKIDAGTLTATVSAFQIARPSAVSIPTTPLPTLELNGEQINRGVEVNVFGEVTEGVRLLGGVMLLDAKLAKTQNGTFDGNRAPGTPKINVAVGGEWDTPFLHGLTLTGRVNHMGESFQDQANTRTVPAWTRVDLGARYSFEAPWNKKPVTIRFNVENVLGSNYWLTSTGGSLYLAMPRTYMLSTTFNF